MVSVYPFPSDGHKRRWRDGAIRFAWPSDVGTSVTRGVRNENWEGEASARLISQPAEDRLEVALIEIRGDMPSHDAPVSFQCVKVPVT